MRFNPVYLVLCLISAASAAPLIADTDVHARMMATARGPNEAAATTLSFEFTGPPKGLTISPPLQRGRPTDNVGKLAKGMFTDYIDSIKPKLIKRFNLDPEVKFVINDYPFQKLPNPARIWFKVEIDNTIYTGWTTGKNKVKGNPSTGQMTYFKNGVSELLELD
ncbi:hypothetical protein BT96DRAFT_1014078 [Gymnopus androsaceus JB14]|uniref:Uncharacterized protein n=1 Tax=Gymnopus androsaceus JB14 TaxID=1447944 RepID=A0A6A4IFU6_9AGAR|nr:hypothetical protein BT96DRAFT_1014078 [Gymnopus androsaceus JB14]